MDALMRKYDEQGRLQYASLTELAMLLSTLADWVTIDARYAPILKRIRDAVGYAFFLQFEEDGRAVEGARDSHDNCNSGDDDSDEHGDDDDGDFE